MTLNTIFHQNRTALVRAAFATALICSMAAFAPRALAQDEAASTDKHLPSGFAQQQVPPSFPDVNQGGQANPAAAMPKPATDTEKAQAAADAMASPATQTSAGGSPSATSAPAQTATSIEGKAPDGAATNTAAAGNMPAPPAETKLVPTHAMGATAQNAGSGASADDGSAASADTGNADVPNPVEDAAAAMDRQEAAQEENAPSSPQTNSVLDKYTSRAAEAAAARDAAGNDTDDALPQVSNLNMVKLEGAGFDNAAGKNVTVGVDGAAQGGKTKEALQEEIRTEAFDAAITGMFPLSPDQVKNLLKRYDTTQKAVKTPVYDAPKPEISVQNVSLDPGVAPPVIKTAVGNVTTLNILDATGAPWPVQDVTWAGDFEIVEPEEGGHIIRITPMSQFARGNIVIRMLTLKTPITMTLETSREVVQYRVDARIPEYGPFATAPIMQGGKSLVAGSPDLTSILDGVMPGGAVKLKVAGVDGRTTAYEMGGTTFVRTPLTLLSPAWQSSVSSADGMNVYALTSSPVLLLSDGGEFMRATLSEKEDLLDE